MKITKIAILALKGMDKGVKERIAAVAGVNIATVYQWILDNKDNGNLTKASVVKVIEHETGLPEDQILEEVELVKIA